MKINPAIFAGFGLLLGSALSCVAWNFAVWPAADASQWAPGLGLTNVVGVAAGSDRTLFLRADGSIVWSWGGSWAGSSGAVKASSRCHDLVLLSDSTVLDWGLEGCAGSAPYTTIPPGLTNVVAVAAGDRHSLVLKANGTCVSWGWMTVGAGYVPAGLNDVVAIAAGFDISGALKSDGSVVAWGYDGYGGTAAPGGLTDGMALAMGHHHGLVLRSNGVVVAWGTTPPAGLTNVVRIAAQQTWSLVQKADGHLAAWNDGIGSQHNVPTQPLTNVIDLAAGSYHGVVLVGDGPPQPLWYLSNQVAIAGNSVAFTGEALGTEPLSYQWLFNGTNLPGAGSPTLTLSNIVPAQAATYAVVVSNAFGVVTNSGGSLTVLPLVITSSPTNATVYGGDTFLNSVAADGQGLVYQWRHDGNDLPGQTNAPLTVSTVTTNEAGAYSVVVSNIFGFVESPAATLSVVPLAIIYQPPDLNVYVGESATFSVGVERNGPFTYQWRKDGADLAGETNASLQLDNVTLQQAGAYSVSVSNPFGSVESSTAMLAVVDSAPIITTQPLDAATWPGGPASFQVNATGSKPLNYQWRLNATVIAGATNSSFVIGHAVTNDIGAYSVLLSNAVSTGLSRNVNLALVPVVIWPTNVLSVMPLKPVLTNTVAVAAGSGFNVALKADGKVAAWGWNGEGETNVPTGLGNVTAVAAGDSHCVALRSNGTVVVWGSNVFGQTNMPGGLSNVMAIAAGYRNTVALRTDGRVIGWGWFDNVRTTNAVPGQDWNRIVTVAAGLYHRVGLKLDGTVVTWLDYSDYSRNRPPAGLTNVVAIAAGYQHSLALKADGKVVAWGDYSYGMTNIPSSVSNVVAIACGYYHNTALRSDGTAISWGNNTGGLTNVPDGLGPLSAVSASLGHNAGLVASADPAIVRSPRAVDCAPLQPVLLSVGAVSSRPLFYQWQLNGQDIPGATNAFHRIASVLQANQGLYRVMVSNELGVVSATARVTVSGVVAWGANMFGQTNVPWGMEAKAVAGGYGHSLALRPGGTIAAWGYWSTAVTNVPANASNVVQISAGPYHSLALKSDGRVLAWGEGTVQVSVPAGLSNVVAVAAGQNHSIALKSDGTVTQWGFTPPPPPQLLSNVVAIAAGYTSGLALKSDGTVASWGNPPNLFADLSNVVAIAAGNAVAVALKADGSLVWAAPEALAPPPTDLTNAVAIAASGNHALAVTSDGGAVAWGSLTAVPADWANVSAVGCGDGHSLMVVNTQDPLIVRQPAMARAYSGNQVLFSAGARSALPLQFQWQFNGADLPGATNGVLRIPAAQAANAGVYALIASNVLGKVSSSNATLAVVDQKPFVRTQPLNASAAISGVARFQVLADGSEPKMYQWRKDGTPIDSATNATLVLSNLARADAGLYSVVVSNAFGSATSSSATLRVMVPQQLQTPVLNTDGSIGLLFAASDGAGHSASDLAYFQVLTSTNLVDWEILPNTLTLTNGMIWFADDAITNRSQRFYRVRELP